MLKKSFATEVAANRSEIAKLKEENAALRDALDRPNLPAHHAGSRAAASGRRRRKSQKESQQVGRHSSYAAAVRASPPSQANDHNAVAVNNHRSTTRPRSLVAGSRKIWGTLSSTTPQVLSNTISSLTNVSEASFTVKRKYKMIRNGSGGNKLVRWWFVLRGSEEIMKELEDKWNPDVSTQVKWKLEPVFCFSDSVTLQAGNNCELQPDNGSHLSTDSPLVPPNQTHSTSTISTPSSLPNNSFLEVNNPGVSPGQ